MQSPNDTDPPATPLDPGAEGAPASANRRRRAAAAMHNPETANPVPAPAPAEERAADPPAPEEREPAADGAKQAESASAPLSGQNQGAATPDGEGVAHAPLSSGRKILRAALMGMIGLAAIALLYQMVFAEPPRRSPISQLPWRPPAPISLDDPKGVEKAEELAGWISAGRAAEVTALAEALRGEFPQNPLILDEIYRAEAVARVEEIAKAIEGLPEPDPQNPRLTEMENVRRLEARLAWIEWIRLLREDWDTALFDAPGARRALESLEDLYEMGGTWLDRWKTAVAALDAAGNALGIPSADRGRRPAGQPDYARALDRLSAAVRDYPAPALPPLLILVTELHKSESELGRLNVALARETLAAALPGDEPPPGEDGEAIASEIRKWAIQRMALLNGRIQAADDLAALVPAMDAAHREGDTGSALERMGEALRTHSDTDPLLAQPRRELEARRTRWADVVGRYDALVMEDESGGKEFQERLMDWVELNRLMREGDDFYAADIAERLASMEKAALEQINACYARMHAAYGRYAPITGAMRSPEQPREPYAAAAAALAAAALEADRLLDMQSVIEALPSAAQYVPHFAFAARIADELKKESNTMWNRARRYWAEGQTQRASWRETCERILLLGEASGNTRREEARQALSTQERP